MALKRKPVTGMKDILPGEMEIRDYVISLIKETYRTFGFSSIETPCVEHIENLCSKQGGDNEKLIFKILYFTVTDFDSLRTLPVGGLPPFFLYCSCMLVIRYTDYSWYTHLLRPRGAKFLRPHGGAWRFGVPKA